MTFYRYPLLYFSSLCDFLSSDIFGNRTINRYTVDRVLQAKSLYFILFPDVHLSDFFFFRN